MTPAAHQFHRAASCCHVCHVVQDKVLCALIGQHRRGQKHSDTLVFLSGHYEASQMQCKLGCHYDRQCDAKQNKIKLNQGGILNTDSTHWWQITLSHEHQTEFEFEFVAKIDKITASMITFQSYKVLSHSIIKHLAVFWHLLSNQTQIY